jgi:hypothetical protein
MSTITLLAGLQDHFGLSQLGAAELKAVDILEQLLDGGHYSTALQFAVAAFLLDEEALGAAIAAGSVTADTSWITTARKSHNSDQHWCPSRHPQVPSAVIRALGLAEQARCFWVAMNASDESWRGKVELIRALAEDWTANDQPAPARLNDVVATVAGTPAPTRGTASTGPEWLISVSIDIAGSTEAKTRLKNLNATPDRQKDFLRLFYQQFLQREMRFYDHLTKSDHARPFSPMALEQIFYVKGIGDEVWLLIEPSAFDREHLLHLLVLLLNSAQAALSNPMFFAATAIEEGPNFDPVEAERAIASGYEQLYLPFKVFIDKVDGAYGISERRATALLPWINGALADGRVAYRDLAKIANRMGMGTGTLTAGTWRNAVRTDYIGHEIDRLFRTAKAAKPLLITVGQNLLDMADSDAAQLSDGSNCVRNLMVRCNPRSDSASRGLTFHVRAETIPAAKMKGIDKDYRVYHFFDPYLLRGQFAQAAIVKRLADERAAADAHAASRLPQFVSDMEKLRTFMNDPSLDPVTVVDGPTRTNGD